MTTATQNGRKLLAHGTYTLVRWQPGNEDSSQEIRPPGSGFATCLQLIAGQNGMTSEDALTVLRSGRVLKTVGFHYMLVVKR